MIYLEKDSNFIQIPKHTKTNALRFDIALFNKMNFTSEYFSNVSDRGGYDLIYEFKDLDFTKLPDGEYVYFLYGILDENEQKELLESGLLQIGKYKNTNKQYETKQESIQYK
jgi:hypothetical protein